MTPSASATSGHAPSSVPCEMERLTVPWYAVQTKYQRELVAEANLRPVCAAVFCPRHRDRVILHGYRREVLRALFPGYLFAAFDCQRELRAVQYAHGVRGIVAFGGQPGIVPPDLLASIMARMQDGLVILQPPALQPGQRVEIVDGPFRGYTGIFQGQRSGAERVAILLDTLTYNARAIVERDALRPVVS